MLKQTVKNLTDKVLPGSKFSSDPTIASEALVDQIGNRTSILSGFAEKTSKALNALSTTNTLRLEAAKEYSAENIDGKFGSEVRKQNPNIAEDKVEKEMLHILMQLHKLLDNHTREEFNNSLLYKKYSTYFDEYKHNLSKSTTNTATETNSNTETNKTYSSIRDAASEKILDKFLPEKTSVDIPEASAEKDLTSPTEKILDIVPEKTSVENLTVISEKTSVNTSEMIPEKTSVDIPEVTPEKTSVEIPEKTSVEKPLTTSEELTPEKPYSRIIDIDSDGGWTEVTPEKTTVDIPEVTSEKTSVDIPEKTSVEIPEKTSIEKSSVTSDEVTPEKTSVEIPEVIPEKTTVDIPEVIPEKKSYSNIRDASSGKILDKIFSKKAPGEVTPEKSEETSIFSKVLGSVNPDTKNANDGEPVDSNEPIVAELKKINHFLEEKIKADKENSILANERLAELNDDTYDPSKKDINKPNDKVKPEKSKSILESLKDKVTDSPGLKKAGGALGKAGSVLATGARLAAPALLATAAAGAAGFAGYKAGQWLNENTGIQAGISDGIDSVKSLFGNSDEDKQKEADTKAAQVLYDKRVSEGKLTDKSAAFFEKQGIKVDKSKIVKLPDAVKSPIVAAVAANVESKDNVAAAQQTVVQPILLNNNSKSSSTPAPRQMISNMNIRNSETTFERVQMQDFWPRTA